MGRISDAMIGMCEDLCKGTADDPYDMFNAWMEHGDELLDILWSMWSQ